MNLTQKEFSQNLKEFSLKLKKLKRSPKFGKVFELYRQQQLLTLSENTLNRQFKVYIKHLDKLNDLRLDRIEPLFIQEFILKDLYLDGKYTTLLYITRLLVTFFDFALTCGLISVNPLKKIYTLPLLKKSLQMQNRLLKHRATLNYKNLRYELMQVIKVFEKKGSERRKLLLEISLRTILRPREVCSLKITDLDCKRMVLKVYKTKTLDVFEIPLTDSLLKAVNRAYSLFGSKSHGYVFSGLRDKKKPLSPQTLNKALKELGFKDRLCAHGIRSIASNYFASHSDKIHPWVAEAMLQHSVGTKVARAYRHDNYFYERVKVTQLWNNFLDGIYNQLRISLNKRDN